MAKSSCYSDTYKRETAAKAEASGNVSQTARELGIRGKPLHTLKGNLASPRRVHQKPEGP